MSVGDLSRWTYFCVLGARNRFVGVISFIDKLVELGEARVYPFRGKNYILLNVNEDMTEVIEKLLSDIYGCLDGFSDSEAQNPSDVHQNPGDG